LDGLEDIRSVNAIHSKISPEKLLEYHLECRKQTEANMQKTDIELDPDEEETLDVLMLKASGLYIKRIDDEEDDVKDKEMRKQALESIGAGSWKVCSSKSAEGKESPTVYKFNNTVALTLGGKPRGHIQVIAKKVTVTSNKKSEIDHQI